MIENKEYGHFVYGLIDPFTNEIRYIGYTNNLKIRLQSHCMPSKLKINNHKNNWIKLIKEKDEKPIIFMLENHKSQQDGLQAEIELIEYYKFIGCNLTNQTAGGETNVIYERTKKIREKTSKSGKGRKHTEEAKRKIGEASRARGGTPCSEETKEKLRIFNTGKTHTEETKTKMSASLKGKGAGIKLSEEHISNMVKNNKSYKLTKNDHIKIKELYTTGNFTQAEIGEMFNVKGAQISRVIHNKTGKYIND